MPDTFDEWPFHVDHVLARVHGGGDSPDNLSWSCTQCNLHKASNFATVDPETGDRVSLFNPRMDDWSHNFTIDTTGRVVGLTAVGRATARLLDMNGVPQLALRQALLAQGEFEK